jgi:hypothetical protein
MLFLKKRSVKKKKQAEKASAQSRDVIDVSAHERIIKSRQALVDLIKFLDSL